MRSKRAPRNGVSHATESSSLSTSSLSTSSLRARLLVVEVEFKCAWVCEKIEAAVCDELETGCEELDMASDALDTSPSSARLGLVVLSILTVAVRRGVSGGGQAGLVRGRRVGLKRGERGGRVRSGENFCLIQCTVRGD